MKMKMHFFFNNFFEDQFTLLLFFSLLIFGIIYFFREWVALHSMHSHRLMPLAPYILKASPVVSSSHLSLIHERMLSRLKALSSLLESSTARHTETRKNAILNGITYIYLFVFVCFLLPIPHTSSLPLTSLLLSLPFLFLTLSFILLFSYFLILLPFLPLTLSPILLLFLKPFYSLPLPLTLPPSFPSGVSKDLQALDLILVDGTVLMNSGIAKTIVAMTTNPHLLDCTESG